MRKRAILGAVLVVVAVIAVGVGVSIFAQPQNGPPGVGEELWLSLSHDVGIALQREPANSASVGEGRIWIRRQGIWRPLDLIAPAPRVRPLG